VHHGYPTGHLSRDASFWGIGAAPSEIRRALIRRRLFDETA
jgi:hypothetical protein